MATDVKLPDLGEGVEDATISRWLVKEGDEVSEGDVLLEVATDKVDTEVPSPVAGKVLKINQAEGSLVTLDDVILVIGAEGESAGSGGEKAAEKAPEAAPEKEAVQEDENASKAEATPQVAAPSENGQALRASPVAKRVAADKGVDLEGVAGTGPGGRITKDDVLASADGDREGGKSKEREALPGDLADAAPLSVLRLAATYNIDLRDIAQGRPLSTLTRYDVMSAVESREAGKDVTVEARFLPPRAVPGEEKPAAPAKAPEKPATEQPAPSKEEATKAQAAAPAEAGANEELVKHTRMRQAIARNVTQSWTTAPHVTTVWDVNMAAVINHRKAHRSEFAAAGVNLTITAYFIEAMIAGVKAVPAANASYTDEGVIIKRAYNIGMAVALPQDANGLGGLIVPVIKNAGDLSLLGIARAVNELADKARKNQLRADDLADGTITLTNYGTSGSREQTPIIIQPQAGILGVGAIEKRPVVISQGSPLEPNVGDSLAFLPMMTMSFSYDHRVLDGATADAFCAAVKKALESYA
ncbi:MAG: 2-oxo acid dehydrogenase subunit E2 [Caldilineaceae bacterium]|nr:2-oxo acid dehydrogenase subunit E2 [Caldilineaceae bacterium]